jgi:hypothetical protein
MAAVGTAILRFEERRVEVLRRGVLGIDDAAWGELALGAPLVHVAPPLRAPAALVAGVFGCCLARSDELRSGHGGDLMWALHQRAPVAARPTPKALRLFFSFWLSHVPLERFEAFWSMVADCLDPRAACSSSTTLTGRRMS